MNPATTAQDGLRIWTNAMSLPSDLFEAGMHFAQTGADLFGASFHYFNDFLGPLAEGAELFTQVEMARALKNPEQLPLQVIELCSLGNYNAKLMQIGYEGSLQNLLEFSLKKGIEYNIALLNSLVGINSGKDLLSVAKKSAQAAKLLNNLPAGIEGIKQDFGIHLENGSYREIARTPRSKLFLVFPLDENGAGSKDLINWELKPIIIGPPQVLGANILAFLPKLGKSYIHNFANAGIPTFVVLMNDITTCEAVQTMAPDDDCTDFVHYAKVVKKLTGKLPTLTGYCQRGFSIAGHFMSGALEGLSDAFFSCVAPFDGTESIELTKYLNDLPPRYRDLLYGTLTYPNGNQVASGKLMALVYKIKALGGREFPLSVFFRDLVLMYVAAEKGKQPSPTVYALNRWMLERTDIPLEMTKESYASYTIPITPEGVLPIKRFGQPVSFNWFKQHPEVLFKLFYAGDDDLVDEPTALAPQKHGAVEKKNVHDMKRGHVAGATSPLNKDQENGPLYWQLQLSRG